MYLLYVDESGVPNPSPSQTSHYVLIGLAVHVGTWFALTRRVRDLKSRYALNGDTDALELHAAWMLRGYREQSLIPSFHELSRPARYDAVKRWRAAREMNDWPSMGKKEVARERKEFRKTDGYIHLTREERTKLYREALRVVAEHRRGVVLFGEAIDKQHLPPVVDAAEVAFTRLIDRFEIFLQHHDEENPRGVVVVDRDSATEDRFSRMLARLQQQDHARGGVDRVIEAPFFLDSRANAGVQVADLCAYAVRRYVENSECEQFETIFPRFFRKSGDLCGLRHSTDACSCLICTAPKVELKRKKHRTRRKHAQNGRGMIRAALGTSMAGTKIPAGPPTR